MRIQRLLGIYLMEFGRKNKTRAKKKEYNVVAFLGVFFLLPKSPCCKVQLKSKIDLEKRLGNLKKKKEMKKLTSNSNCFVLGSYSNCIKIRLDRCVGKKQRWNFFILLQKTKFFLGQKFTFTFILRIENIRHV